MLSFSIETKQIKEESMQKISIITVLGLTGFLVLGCSGTQPSFDASNTTVQSVKENHTTYLLVQSLLPM